MKIALALLLVGVAVYAAPHNKIEPRLASSLATRGTANVLVSMRERTASALASIQGRSYKSRDQQVNDVAHTLMNFADVSQKNARDLLTSLNVSFDIFWITNQIYIRGATSDVINALVKVENVREISEEFEVKIDPVIQGKPSVRSPGMLAEWGIETVEAPAAWALPGGNNGTGAVVGSIDTGVHPTHKDLAMNFVGEYGWRDFTLFGTATPRDDQGHGTHTVGSIAGANGIGVAPGAKWMACKALNAQGSGTNANLVNCGQFMACPTLPNGVSPDCTKAPHVINNSWGGGQANPFYNEVINAWHAAGIIPVFANGNSGPECRTANSPADSLAGVLGVGATDSGNAIAYFSSKGPTSGGRQKPDIAAPGQEIRSAWIGASNEEYNTISGTSMAAPHVAGVVALLKAKNPMITYDQVVDILTNTTNKEIVDSLTPCEGVGETTFPNYSFGHGIINARAALQRVIDGTY